ncbi:hypothetical protein FOL46_009984, partial [Perkinsus olseni]
MGSFARASLGALAFSSLVQCSVKIPIQRAENLIANYLRADGYPQFPIVDTGSSDTVFVWKEWYEKEYSPKKCVDLPTKGYVSFRGDVYRTDQNRTIGFAAEGEIEVFDHRGVIGIGNNEFYLTFGLMCGKDRHALHEEPYSLLGLGMREPDDQSLTLLEQLYATPGLLRTPSFSLYLERQPRDGRGFVGELTFGGPDSTKYSGPLNPAPIANAGNWDVNLNYVEIGASRLATFGERAFVDTGTNYLQVPSGYWKTLHSLLSNASGVDLHESVEFDIFTVPCNKRSMLPDMVFGIRGIQQTVRLSIPQVAYVALDRESGTCDLQLTRSVKSYWILPDFALVGNYLHFAPQGLQGYDSPVIVTQAPYLPIEGPSLLTGAEAALGRPKPFRARAKVASSVVGDTTDRPPATTDDRLNLTDQVEFVRKCLFDGQGGSLIKSKVDSCVLSVLAPEPGSSRRSSLKPAESQRLRVQEFAEDLVGLCYRVVKRELEEKATIEAKYARLVASNRKSQKRYLEDVSALRDRIRGVRADLDGIAMTKGDLEVIFYDPVSHLDEELKQLVLDICNERLRLMFQRPNEMLKEALKTLMADHPDLMQWLGVEAPPAAVETVNDEEVDRLKRTNEMQTLRVAEVEEEKARLTERLEAQETELERMRLEIARLLMELEAANEGRQDLMDRVEALEEKSAAAREAIVETERALNIKVAFASVLHAFENWRSLIQDEEAAALRVELQQRQEEAGELGHLRAQLEEERYRSEEALKALRREGEKAGEEARRREEEARKEQRRETEALQRAMDAHRAQFVEMQEENRKMAKRADEMSVELAEAKKKAEKLEGYRKFKKMYEEERRKSASLERELREATELLLRPKAPEFETGPREMKQSSSGISQSKPWMNVFDRLHLDAIDRVTRKQGLAERWCEKLMARVSERLLTMLSDDGAPRRAPRKVRGRNHFVRRQQIENDREAWQRMLASDSSGDDFSDDELDTGDHHWLIFILAAAAVSCSSLHEPSTEFRRMLRKSASKRRRKTQTLPTIMQDPLRVQDSGNYETYSQSQSLLVRQLADCIVAKLVEPAVDK